MLRLLIGAFRWWKQALVADKDNSPIGQKRSLIEASDMKRGIAQIEVRRLLRQVLLGTWDPIGVGGNPSLADEYDGYLSRLTAAAMQPEGVNAVELELRRIEESLGMPCDPMLRHQAAEDIVKIVSNGNSGR